VSEPDLLASLAASGFAPRDLLAIAIAPGVGVGLAAGERTWSSAGSAAGPPWELLARVESQLRPRWLWWSGATASALVTGGVRVAACWDVAAAHRLLFGGWAADPATVWATLHELPARSVPGLGQLDLLRPVGDDGGDPEDPVRPDR
jgi:DNA polymerase I